MTTRVLKILAVGLGLCTAAGTLVAQVTVTNVYSFLGNGGNDGAYPEAGLVQGTNGNFYGTCIAGGANGYDTGTIFVVTPGGLEATLHTFLGPLADDGDGPRDSLVLGRDGNFYGTASGGGTNDDGNDGTIFRINPETGMETSLYSFGSYTNDGISPLCARVLGNDGNFYGTTSGGGTYGDGTVFRITPEGVYTNIYSFGGTPADGNWPFASLVLGTDGNFYGTTTGGGSNANFSGIGTIFKITTNGTETVLYSFGTDYPAESVGYGPQTPLVLGSDGNFYGTTTFGGDFSDGTVFRISPAGDDYTNLYSFSGYPTDGDTPNALVQGSDGNFYGTCAKGGTNYDGTIFRISPAGDYTNLYSFIGSANGYPDDGQSPQAPLLQVSDGTFYGTTAYGGIAGGNVFHLIVPLSSPANQISAIQIEGANVLVSIPSVSGETYQLQDRDSLTTGAWADVAGQVLSIGGLLTVTNFGGFTQPQQFYRFSIIP
jgi:uncharacterized repeat protein (TIGR03803 family)